MIFSTRTARCLLAAGLVTGAGVGLAGTAQAASANAQDKTWLVAAHQANLAEIAAGKDAEKNASDNDVTALGKMFVTDHTKLDAGVKKLATKYGVTLPSAPSAAQQASLAAVKQNSGNAYDKAWVRAEITGHLQAKAGGQKEMAGGSASDILAADRTAAPIVQHHLNELAGIASDLGISAPTSVSAGTGGQAAAAMAGDGERTALAVGATSVGVVLLGSAYLVRRRRPVTARA